MSQPSPIRHNATRDQMRLRVLQIVELLATGWRKFEIKQFVRSQWGLSYRQAEHYLALARRKMLDELETPRKQLIAESLACYQSIIKSPKASPREKLLARKQIDELLGLQMPKKIAPTSPDGTQPATIDVSVKLEKALEQLPEDQLRALANLNKIVTGQAVSSN